MIKKILIITGLLFFTSSVFAYWEWTPQTHKWINPLYAVKSTAKKQFEWAQTFQKVNRNKRAIMEYKKILNNFPNSKYAPKALFEIGEIYFKKDDYQTALKEYQEIIDKYPQYPELSVVLDRENTIAQILLKKHSYKGPIGKVKKFFSNSNSQLKEVSQIVRTNPYSNSSAELSLKLASQYRKNGNTAKSKKVLNNVIKNFSGTKWEEKARYKLVQEDIKSLPKVTTDVGKFNDIENIIDQFLSEYPHTKYKPVLLKQKNEMIDRSAAQLYSIEKYYEKTGEKQSAYFYYKLIKKDYPGTKYAKMVPSI
ncbi:MAG: outer membrane protein assembly factor BamD [Candidatus Omnitrophica bacterium]|nr:outer membrane protein assembly factor BamD [Candidatus Omnitrophota bacterium]